MKSFSNGVTNNFQNVYYISLLIFRKKGKYRKQVMLHCVKLSISIMENLYLHKSQ